MKNELPHIAILSPNKNAYSETFIQAHKSLSNVQVFYYFGSTAYPQLEGEGLLLKGIKKFVLKTVSTLKKQPNDAAGKQALLQSWKKNNIRLVLAEYGNNAAAHIDIIKKSGLPLVVHFHGLDASVQTILDENKDLYPEVFAYAAKVIAVSQAMHQKLLALGCPPEKLVYNVYGPQEVFFEVKPHFNQKQFVAAGRFTEKKAPYYTLLAFKKAVEKHPDAKLMMAGDGYLRPMCENLVKYLGIEKNVEFVGIVSPEQFKSLMTDSLAFVQHSIIAKNGDSEGTPLAVLESGAAGLPVIATKHAGISDVVLHGETGLLCNEHDVDAMAKNMLLVLDNPRQAARMGANARIRIRESFSMQKHLKGIEAVIAEWVS